MVARYTCALSGEIAIDEFQRSWSKQFDVLFSLRRQTEGAYLKMNWKLIVKIGVVVLVAFILFQWNRNQQNVDDTQRNAAGEVVAAGDIGATKIQVGDCINRPSEVADGSSDGEPVDFTQVKGVPCTELHDGEIIGEFHLSGDSFPDDATVGEQATRVCREKFEVYTGVSFDLAPHSMTTISPTESSWKQGDRTVQCYAFLEGEQMGASIHG